MKSKTLRIAAVGAAIALGAAFGMTACAKEEDAYFVDGDMLIVNKPCTVRYEAENVNTDAYEISADNPSAVVERADASGGKFLAAATGNTNGDGSKYFAFTLNLQFNAEIKMTAAYSQPESKKGNEMDMRDSYNYLIDENKSVSLSEENAILSSRDDVTIWEKVSYDSYTLPQGAHSFRVFVLKNTGKGNPDIDYIEFDFSDIDGNNFDGVAVPANDFHTPVQYAYIHDDYANVANYAKGVVELSRPGAIALDFSDLKNSSEYAVEYADNANFSGSAVVTGLKTKLYNVYNLKLGQQLYWRAATSENGLKKAKTRNITVAGDGPRNIYIDGLTNVRDIGGYSSTLGDGGKIRQGLYYRGAALVDVDRLTGVENKKLITDAGKKEMLRLGIKQEIDLRDEKQCTGPYVDGINYNPVPIPSGTEATRFEKFENEYKRIFSIIADADRAPVYLHCTAGADRTGICTFILLTVCGVSYEDAARDYLFTNFSTHGERKLDSEFDKWYKKLDNFSGDTKAEKAKSWLISKGVTARQVETIREIFVEGYVA